MSATPDEVIVIRVLNVRTLQVALRALATPYTLAMVRDVFLEPASWVPTLSMEFTVRVQLSYLIHRLASLSATVDTPWQASPVATLAR